MAARIANPQLQNPHAEPASTKKGLFEVDAVLATSVASWLKKRGKVSQQVSQHLQDSVCQGLGPKPLPKE